MIAQSAAKIVIIAVWLSPVSNASKFSFVALKTMSANAIIVKIQVKTFIIICFKPAAL